MALVDRLKRWRSLARLRNQVRRRPSPATFGELAEKLISLGETDLALRAAEEGLAHFPDSERLAHVRTYAKKGRMTGEIRRLREEVHRRPNPLSYAQLAQIYRDLGSHDEALAIAAECAERFPLSEASCLIQGEIRAERFCRDLIAKDAVIAEASLAKVTRLNAQNVAAHMLLAELYWLVGMAAECRRQLRQVLAISPVARDAQQFLRELDLPGAADEGEATFAERAEKIEKEGAFANDPALFPGLGQRRAVATQSTPVDADAVKSELVSLGETDGVRNALVLERDGSVLADCKFEGGLSRVQFADLVVGIRDVADDASRRMDTGALVRADIEGPGGNVTMIRVHGRTVALYYADPLRSDVASEMLEDFIGRNLASLPEEAHA